MKGTDVMAKEGFSNFEIAMIEQIANRVANVMIDRAKEIVDTEMLRHQAACPLKAVVTRCEDDARVLEIRISNLKAYGAGWITGISALAAVVSVGFKCVYDYFKSAH